nr:hypothetical protein [Tanacetum cinerariifolium]
METSKDVYSRHRIIVVTSLKIIKYFGYSHMEEIVVRRQDDQLYKFRESDFKRLRRQDIEDMLLLFVQSKLSNLNLKEQSRKLPKEDQHHKARHIPFRSQKMTPYTAYLDIQGIIYEDEMKRNCLMRTDEFHKFSDETRNHVCTALNDIASGSEIDYFPKQKWSKQDKQRARVMIKKIDKKLRDRRLMRNLENETVTHWFTLIVLSALRRSGNENMLEILSRKFFLKLNLPDHRILKDGVLKSKNFKKDAILKLFKMTNQERYEHVGPKVTSAQDGKDYKMAKKEYDWLMISRSSRSHSYDELSDKELKQIEADCQAIQTILLGLPKDIYAAVDSCETVQEIWFTSNEGESIKSYYHRFLKLMNDLKRNKHFPEKIASNLKFLNNLQPEWSRHATIVHQTKDLHITGYTQLYDFLKYNQKENHLQQPMPNPEDITDLTTAMNMALALMAKAFKLNYSTPTNNNQRISSNPRNKQIAQPGNSVGYNDVVRNQVIQNAVQNPRVQNVRNQNGLNGVQGNRNQNQIGNGNLVAARAERNAIGKNGNQIRCYNCRGVEEYDLMAAAADLDEIEEVNAKCILMANLQQASTSGTQTDIAPIYDTDGSAENAVQNPGIQIVENINGLSVVSKIENQYENGNVVPAPAKGNGNGINGNPISTQEEFEFMAAADAYEKTKREKANCTLENNLQQASTSSTQSDKAPVYDSDGSAKVHLSKSCYDNDIFNMFTQEEQYTEQLEPILEPHQVPQNDSNVISEVSSVEQGGETINNILQLLRKHVRTKNHYFII